MFNPISFLFYLTIILGIYHLIKYLQVENKTVHPSVAGNIKDCNDKLPKSSKSKKVIKLKINDKIVSSHDENIFVGKTFGDSMFKLDGPVNGDVFFANTRIEINVLKKGAFVVLRKTMNDGSYCYKLRQFIAYDAVTKEIKSQTIDKEDKLHTSTHSLNESFYVGKIIASFAV